MSEGKYVRVSPDLELYYEEAGTGTPLIFVPGWAGTTEFYRYQMPYFAREYRALTYDPRSHGRSSKTLENNHYTQHGKDLKALMDALSLRDVVLAALSAGVYDIYAYLRAYGMDNLRACVFIDDSPIPVAAEKDGWADFADLREAAEFINAVVYDFRGLIREFIPPMMKREMRQDELDWVLDQLSKTPNYASALLAAGFLLADYREEARMIDGGIPVLNVLSEDQAEAGKMWLRKNAPHSEVVVLGKHLMMLEFPEQFNAAVGAFLDRVI